MNAEVISLVALMVLPCLAMVPAFTPPEWWWSVHDDSTIARLANNILWRELRLGAWDADTVRTKSGHDADAGWTL